MGVSHSWAVVLKERYPGNWLEEVSSSCPFVLCLGILTASSSLDYGGRGGEDGAEAKTTVCAAGNHMLLLATGLPAGRKGCVIRLPLLRITSDLRLARKFFYVLFGK
jgi:hypothetical protein